MMGFLRGKSVYLPQSEDAHQEDWITGKHQGTPAACRATQGWSRVVRRAYALVQPSTPISTEGAKVARLLDRTGEAILVLVSPVPLS